MKTAKKALALLAGAALILALTACEQRAANLGTPKAETAENAGVLQSSLNNTAHSVRADAVAYVEEMDAKGFSTDMSVEAIVRYKTDGDAKWEQVSADGTGIVFKQTPYKAFEDCMLEKYPDLKNNQIILAIGNGMVKACLIADENADLDEASYSDEDGWQLPDTAYCGTYPIVQ